jgi:acetyltransferase-like isoleucine patch superfamily enzyme
MRLKSIGVVIGKDVRFYGMPIVDIAKGSSIKIGDRVVLCSDSRFTSLGVNHPVVMRTLRSGAEIVIGNDCGLSGSSICSASRVQLGNECLIGANVVISDTDFHPIEPFRRRFNNNSDAIKTAPVIIQDNVFIGTGVTILKGVNVGRNSVIGAMSLVLDDIQSDMIYGGVPAKFIRKHLE